MNDLSAKPTVVVVSAFGRGHWLAVELKNVGFDVSLVDVSESLGRWAPEDWEGPFGYFQSDELTASQKVRLDEEDYTEQVEEGFVLWLKSGPLDLRGPHSQYLLDRREIPAAVQEYVNLFDKLPTKKLAALRKSFNAMAFKDTWFAHFAHSLGASVYVRDDEALGRGRPLPLFTPYGVRRVSRRGAEKSLAWLRTNGVHVYSAAQIKDMSSERSKVLSLEVVSEWSGVLKADQFIWALSSLETERLGEKFMGVLYPSGAVRPDWVWMRFRLELENSNLFEVLPTKLAIIEDLGLPWTHTNLLLLQKTSSTARFDAWARIPEVKRFQRSYIEETGARLSEILQQRLPATAVKLVEWPQEYHYDEAVVGPARFGVLDPKKRSELRTSGAGNLYFHSPELCATLDWTGQFQHQNQVLERLRTWKAELDKKIEKQKSREKETSANP